ncbi:MAG: response regulator transcription factor [Nocardioidaceae bacterium]|jgi:DNA-binding NarL/FixJ family response regulator|nr:response regulator transcription factor [Nocardioidaceae bacterium]
MSMTTLIVDDHAGFRASARVLLEMEGFEVVGEAADGATGVSAAESLRPEFVLLDVQLPDTHGFDVAREILGRGLTKRVVLVSSRDESDYGDSIHSSGALGFVPKAELSGDRLRALFLKEPTCG